MAAPGLASLRERARLGAMSSAALKVSRLMIAGWVGWVDHTHSLVGLYLPGWMGSLVARRFQTW